MRPRLILAGLLLAQLADAASFLVGVQRLGITPEANGWALALHELGGVPAVLVAKGLAIVVTLVVLAAAAHRYPRLVVLTGATATSIGLLGATLNTLTFALFA